MRELLPRWRRGHGSDFQSRFNHVQSLPIFLIVSSIVQWVGKLWATDPFIGPLAHVTDESGTRIGYHRMLIFWNFERCKLEAADFKVQTSPTQLGQLGHPATTRYSMKQVAPSIRNATLCVPCFRSQELPGILQQCLRADLVAGRVVCAMFVNSKHLFHLTTG